MKEPEQMSEAELADFYYAQRDTPDALGEELFQAPAGRLSSMVSVRFSPEEAARLRKAADASGMTLSAYLRYCALSTCDQPVDIDRVRRDVEEAGRRLGDALNLLQIKHAG